MKKTVSILLCLLLAAGLFSGCGSGTGAANTAGDGGPLSVVVTIFPIYDWVRQLAGDGGETEITMLLDSGVDLHSYQPTAADILKIVNCDLFIYVGGESDAWVEDALAEAGDDGPQIIDLLETLGDAAKEEELVEGMEDEEGEDEEMDDGAPEYDEHVWLSLRNARTLCSVIADALGRLDPANAARYADNLAAYTAELAVLDAAYADAAEKAAVRTVLFGDRFPFRYLVDDYGLDYYAAFSGCSAETEASFETIIFLAGKADELALRSILQLESSDGSIARTIRDATQTKDQSILTMDSLQSMTAKDAADGVTYLSVMRDNLEVLETALQD